ncbi:hypothetical protein T06_9096 [Trichinella sp. T6]|nr:hypothetical protein T06_9096 [Trichinella sp. T6]
MDSWGVAYPTLQRRIWLSGLDGNALEMETEIDKEMDVVIPHDALSDKYIIKQELEWRWWEPKIPSTKIENHFPRHCVCNLLVSDTKLDRGSNESGKVWNILWQRESSLSPFTYQKVLCRRRTLTKTFYETSSTTWTVAVLDRRFRSHNMDHFGSGLYSGSHGGQRHD